MIDRSRWETLEGIKVIEQVISALRNQKLLEPGGSLPGNPVDLKALVFPEVKLCNELALKNYSVTLVFGKQVFSDAVLKKVDLTGANLDYSVWNNCSFYDATFDNAKLRNVGFFGCNFENCSFFSTSLKDVSFSIALNGRETTLINCIFNKADFQGASCSSPVFKYTTFAECNLDTFVFEKALFESVNFRGKYKEITLRGSKDRPERNIPQIDLSDCIICWLNANHGIDLANIRIPTIGKNAVIRNRMIAVEAIERLSKDWINEQGAKALNMLATIFSDKSPSPLSKIQDTFFLSKCMIQELGEGLSENDADLIFDAVAEYLHKEKLIIHRC